MMNWFNNENYWSLFYDWMFPEESFQQAKEQVDDIIKITGVRSGSVLDLCCGPGRHSVPLGKRGFLVTGVDIQQFLIEKAQKYSEKENVSVEYIKENMLIFKRPESFDLVINMYSSFGYFSDPEDDFRVLENTYNSLRPGGKLLIDVRGKEIHAMENVTEFSQEMPNRDLIFHRSEVNEDWTRSDAEWIYIRDGSAYKFKMSVNLYCGSGLRALLQKAGFSGVQVYGDLKKRPYNQNAKRLVVVAEKT
ncbi:MAG: class I SAM-dependent methyltransferase [Thermodesulfobacteriota bacterium]|nr:class I SAM-dependent methyltransferase [Thermodesulfobacteriota bacterium]